MTQPIPVCVRCGAPHVNAQTGKQACKAHVRNGGPCKLLPIHGAKVCRMHGGSSAATKGAIARRATEERASKALAQLKDSGAMGGSTDLSPTEALLEEVQRTAGHVRWLAGVIAQLEKEHLEKNDGVAVDLGTHPLVWGITEVKEVGASEYTGTDETHSAGMNVWYVMYREERKHLVAATTAAIKAGIEERRVRLAESQGDLVASVIRRILDDLDLSSSQKELVSTVVPTHLRALEGTA